MVRTSLFISHHISHSYVHTPILSLAEPYAIRINFPNLREFNGIQVKRYSVNAKDTVKDVCIYSHTSSTPLSLTKQHQQTVTERNWNEI